MTSKIDMCKVWKKKREHTQSASEQRNRAHSAWKECNTTKNIKPKYNTSTPLTELQLYT